MTYPGHVWVNDDLIAGDAVDADNLGEMDAALVRAHNRISPPQAITYAATITPDASTGSVFYCIATGNVALAEPTGGVDGKTVTVAIQASGAARIVTLTDGTTATTPAGEWWVGTLLFLQTPNVWLLIG